MFTHPPRADGLVLACVEGDTLAHLTVPFEGQSLCERPVEDGQPGQSFRVRGCAECLVVAQDVGYTYVLDSAWTWINLQRMTRGNAIEPH